MPKFQISITREDEERGGIGQITSIIEAAIRAHFGQYQQSVVIELEEMTNADELTFEGNL